jgi:hypothetical protein
MKETARMIALLVVPLLLSAQEAGAATLSASDQVPLFARFLVDGASLQSYRVPIHARVTLHKIVSVHVNLNGEMQYVRPDRLLLTIGRVPEQQRQFFVKLATPRTWPLNYDLQLTGTSAINGLIHYAIHGVPKHADDGVDYLVANVSNDISPTIDATWFLSGGGTITMRIETAMIGGYVLPVRQNADIKLPGYKIHADISYGEYLLKHQSARTKSAASRHQRWGGSRSAENLLPQVDVRRDHAALGYPR